MKVGDRQGEQTHSSVSPPHVFCRVGKLEVESCSKGAAGSKQTASLKRRAFAEDLVVFEVSSIESKGERRGGRGNRV